MSRFLDELRVTPMADGTNWRINSEFRYEFGPDSNNQVINIAVPILFITDFASIPKIIQNVYPVWWRYGAAAIIHDWLYWDQFTTRDVADNVLRDAMETLAVEEHVITDIYNAVHLFGQASWDRNTALKRSGYTRMASTAANPPYASAV